MQNPKLYSTLAKYYDKLENQYRNYDLESEWLASQINETGSKKILDISCGTGRHVTNLFSTSKDSSNQLEIVAMDASPQMVKIAKRRNDQQTREFLMADFLRAPFKEDTFDFIFCMYWSLAGLDSENVKIMFRKVGTILKERGRFVFDVENAEGIKEYLLGKPFVDAFFVDEEESCSVIRLNLSTKIEPDLVDWRAFYILDWGTLSRLITDRMNLRFYKRSTLESMLEEAGFEIESVSSSPSGSYERNSPSLYFVTRRK